MKNYFKAKYKEINSYIETYVSDSSAKKIFLFLDSTMSRIMLGSNYQEYFQYEFFRYRFCQRKKFMVNRNLQSVKKLVNNPQKRPEFDTKSQFNEKYNSFLNRDWLDTTTCSLEQFVDFTSKHTQFFVKPTVGRYGIGSGVKTVQPQDKLEDLFSELKKERALIEELLEQYQEFHEFNPTSVNTLRIVTLIDSAGNVNIMTGTFRMGRLGKSADNFHHNGIAALVDISSGVVYSSGVDKNLNRYYFHPDSKKQIIGYQIPYWNDILNKVREAALINKDVGYVGWDVTLNTAGQAIIIEGNYAADPDVTQMPDRIGKWPLYKEILNI